MLNRTFGCIRVVWNRTLATRHARYHTEGKSTSYAETDRALTEMKKLPELEWLKEVSSVPLQQTLRHQHNAFTAFFQKRARYSRYKSRNGRQSASYTRSAFTMRAGVLKLAKAAGRRDFLDKASAEVVRRFDAVAVEDLAVANMVRNRSLAKSISRTGWRAFRTLLEYKAHRDGRCIAIADRWYPSTKTCSACGHLLSNLSLGTRQWTCPTCGTRHDRDINAAKNIAVAAGLVETINACGADVRRVGATLAQPAVKQEPSRVTEGIPRL